MSIQERRNKHLVSSRMAIKKVTKCPPIKGNDSSGKGESNKPESQTLQKLKDWFLQELQISTKDQTTVEKYLRAATRLHAGFVVLALPSCSIDTFGLISDSAAVVIGAMLVGPMMTPILSATPCARPVLAFHC